MRRTEQDVYEKLKQDFPSEIAVLEKGLDTIWQCSLILIEKAPLLNKPNLNINLKNAKSQDRCSASQTLLIYHATMFLRAARLLLLTGYLSPSLSCLRSTFESIKNAHICSRNDAQAMRWFDGKKVEKPKGVSYPRQMTKALARQINDALSQHGVHANYLAFGTQAYYPGVVFSEENKREYKFFTLRNIHIFLFISNLFLDYLLDTKPFLKDKVPDATAILQGVKVKADEVGTRLKKELEYLGTTKQTAH